MIQSKPEHHFMKPNLLLKAAVKNNKHRAYLPVFSNVYCKFVMHVSKVTADQLQIGEAAFTELHYNLIGGHSWLQPIASAPAPPMHMLLLPFNSALR